MEGDNLNKLFSTNTKHDENIQIKNKNYSLGSTKSFKGISAKKARVNRRDDSNGVQKSAPKRKKSSEKERERNEEIKANLQHLARKLPYVKKDLSRIRTLRLAKEYIKHLTRIVQGETTICPHTGQERPLSLSDFERVVHRELQTNNSYKDRAEIEIMTSSSSCSRLSFSEFSPQMDFTSPTAPTQPPSYDATPRQPSTAFENNFLNEPNDLYPHKIYAHQEWENHSFESSSTFLPQAAILMEANNRNSTKHVTQNSTYSENINHNGFYCYF